MTGNESDTSSQSNQSNQSIPTDPPARSGSCGCAGAGAREPRPATDGAAAGAGNATITNEADAAGIRDLVRDGYARIAAGAGGGCCGPSSGREAGAGASSIGSCCGGDAEAFAQGLGYATEELASLPEGANLGLSCGNPTALAALQRGRDVLDLGSGAGFDVFIAARKVGSRGPGHRRRHDAGDARARPDATRRRSGATTSSSGSARSSTFRWPTRRSTS